MQWNSVYDWKDPRLRRESNSRPRSVRQRPLSYGAPLQAFEKLVHVTSGRQSMVVRLHRELIHELKRNRSALNTVWTSYWELLNKILFRFWSIMIFFSRLFIRDLGAARMDFCRVICFRKIYKQSASRATKQMYVEDFLLLVQTRCFRI